MYIVLLLSLTLLNFFSAPLQSAENINSEDIAVHALCLMGKQALATDSSFTSEPRIQTTNQPSILTSILSTKPTIHKKHGIKKQKNDALTEAALTLLPNIFDTRKESKEKTYPCAPCINVKLKESDQSVSVNFFIQKKLISAESIEACTFTKFNPYKKHMEDVHAITKPGAAKEARFCGDCKKTFTHKSNYNTHLALHTINNNYYSQT